MTDLGDYSHPVDVRGSLSSARLPDSTSSSSSRSSDIRRMQDDALLGASAETCEASYQLTTTRRKREQATMKIIATRERRQRQRNPGAAIAHVPWLLMMLLLATLSCDAYSNSAPPRPALLSTSMFLDQLQSRTNTLLWKPPPLLGASMSPSIAKPSSYNLETSISDAPLQRRRGRLGLYFMPGGSAAETSSQDYLYSQPSLGMQLDSPPHGQALLLADDDAPPATSMSPRRGSHNNNHTVTSARAKDFDHFGFAEQLQDEAAPWKQRSQPRQRRDQPRATPRERIEQFSRKRHQHQSEPKLEANSLAEWSRTVDLEPLLQRRQVIKHEKLHGKAKLQEEKVDIDQIGASLKARKPSVDQARISDLYFMARKADKRGDVKLTKRILHQLLEITPEDARLYRRLARVEADQGRLSEARRYLQQGLRLQPKNAFLWHGMGTVAPDTETAKDYYRKSIAYDAGIPHAHHALGVLLHSQGQIAAAMGVFKQGIQNVDAREAHRLHHALGDVYRDAKVWDMATICYQRAIQLSPHESSLGFSFTNLAFVKYEEGKVHECRQWLVKAINNYGGRNANAWQALAQLEESEGNIDAARAVCIKALATYERFLLASLKRHKIPVDKTPFVPEVMNDPIRLKNEFLKQVPVYRSGDRFFNVYRTWLRLEACHGSFEAVEEIYERAKIAFPNEFKFTLDMASYYLHQGLSDRAPKLFEEACKIGLRHADPYRIFADSEMRQGNYIEARRIYYEGATKVTRTPDGSNPIGLAELFHSWGICEWHLGALNRADTLFDHALRMTPKGSEGSMLRSVILYTMARFEYAREEHLLAQHCIGLCLEENFMPGGTSKVWELWSEVAMSMDNDSLARLCSKQADKAKRDEEVGQLSRSAGVKRPQVAPQDVANMLRREPWHGKLFYSSLDSVLFRSPQLPEA